MKKYRKWKALSYHKKISGHGGGGKGGSGGSEDPNNARSRAIATVLMALSEGPIKGFPDGQDIRKFIYFDETVLMNPDNTLNFKGVTVEFRSGTQSQLNIPGTDQGISNNIAVGVKVTASGGPITRSISSGAATAIKVTITTPGFRSVDGDGNIKGNEVDFSIALSTNGGAFVTQITDKFWFKTAGGYARDYIINAPINPGGNWQIRVARSTADSTSDKSTNELYWQSIAAIIEKRLRYPNTALLFVRFDAAYFRQIPRISIKLMGIICRVPDNYDPVTRVYTGFWDGTWKLRYSNNPAWILLEMMTNKRFGCGDYIDIDAIDKGSFYKIARRCDELVSDGNSGQEPRYVFNEYFRQGEDAWTFLNRILASINCLAYYSGGQIVLLQDAPGAPIGDIFTQSNVVRGYGDDGKMTQPPFRYERTSQQAIHTVALSKWADPNDFDRLKSEYVDLAMLGKSADLKRLGYRPLDLSPQGCTSKAQAARYARHALATEILERELLYFGAGSQGMLRAPGDVIRIQDNHRSGKRLGGRVKSATANTITLDAPVEITNSITSISILIFEEEITKTVNMPIGTHQTLQIFPAFSELPAVGAVWVLSTPKPPKLYAVRTVSEDNAAGTYGMGAVSYSEDKWLLIDQVGSLPPSPSTRRTPPSPPVNLEVFRRPDGFFVGWGASESKDVVTYVLERAESESNEWVPVPMRAGSTDADILAPTYAPMDFRVAAVNIYGRQSIWLESISNHQTFGYVAERAGDGSVRLDRYVELLAGTTYYLRTAEEINGQVGYSTRVVTNTPGITRQISVNPPFKPIGTTYVGTFAGGITQEIKYMVISGSPSLSALVYDWADGYAWAGAGRTPGRISNFSEGEYFQEDLPFPILSLKVPAGLSVFTSSSKKLLNPVPGSSWELKTTP